MILQSDKDNWVEQFTSAVMVLRLFSPDFKGTILLPKCEFECVNYTDVIGVSYPIIMRENCCLH